MSNRQVLALVARRVLVAALLTLLGVVVVGATQLTWGKGGLQPRGGRYRAETKLLYDIPRGAADQVNQAYLMLVIKALAEDTFIQTNAVASEASKRVGGAYSADEILERLRVDPVPGAPIVTISISGDSPADAVALVKAITSAYTDWVAFKHRLANVPPAAELVVEPIDPPDESLVVDESARAKTRIVAGGTVAATLGVLVAMGLPLPGPRTAERAPHLGRRRLRVLQLRSRDKLALSPAAGGAE